MDLLRVRHWQALVVAALLAMVPMAANAGVAVYAGTYAGTYRAQVDTVERGSWCAVVDTDGSITGMVHSDVTGRQYPFNGTVTRDGGMAMSTGQTGAGSIFAGMIEDDMSVSGTWRNVSAPERFNGTFEGAQEPPGTNPLCGEPGA